MFHEKIKYSRRRVTMPPLNNILLLLFNNVVYLNNFSSHTATHAQRNKNETLRGARKIDATCCAWHFRDFFPSLAAFALVLPWEKSFSSSYFRHLTANRQKVKLRSSAWIYRRAHTNSINPRQSLACVSWANKSWKVLACNVCACKLSR